MSTPLVAASDQPPSKVVSSKRHPRFFYSVTAAALLVFMFVGFHFFYLQGKAYPNRELAPPIRTLIIAHGVSMTIWMLLFLVQPLLIATGRRRIHMAVGKFGILLAAVILVLGLKVGIEATRVGPPETVIWGLTYKQFMAVPVVSIIVFAIFVTLGIVFRYRPEIHRPMMLLATLAALPAAVSRIDALNSLYAGTIMEAVFGPFFMTLVIGAVLLAVKWAMTRSVDRWFATGFAAEVAISILVMKIAPTPAWDKVASLLLGY